MSKRIIVSGAYGVGKSEFCVQYALQHAPCTIGDFDILNPFFRPREIKDWLRKYRIDVIDSHLHEGLNQDVPAMSFAFQQAILNDETILIDCAGSVNGLNPLKSLSKAFDDAHFYVVINLNRAQSQLHHIETMIEQFERLSNRHVNGFIHNTHLCEETTSQMIIDAQKELEILSKKLHIPILITMLEEKFRLECIGFINNEILSFKENRLREKWMKGDTR